MDVDDKIKRFRLHVVKEIYQTERDYTDSLEFTVDHILSKLRLKAANDKSLSEEHISKLFSNVDRLLVIHKRLVADLQVMIGSTPSYDSPVGQCYLKHQQGFREYKTYGENNEHAQKILYQLENDQAFKAFFLGVMLLGGKTEASISSYLFKPIQRICKYPLLFRELLKYTPVDHSDYNATNHALSMMRELCSVINEAKRRVERLELIADWQGTVEGWEGSAVVDTCAELVKEGPLIKISAGNMQERVFFLFDNLLVYCKRNVVFPLRSKTEQKTLQFKGRIPVANIEIENIEDGTADYHTSGTTVVNGWKVRNLAKNKWFVLIAKTPGEKQQWIDAIKGQKDRIQRVTAGIARETRLLMIDKGQKLHRRLTKEGKILQDHRYRLRVYPKSFTGCDFVQWLIEIEEAADGSEAMRLGQGLLENGVIHHVSDKHQFKNSQIVYRFRVDDGTFHSTNQSGHALAKGLRIYSCLHSFFHSPIQNHRSGLRQIKCSITGARLVDLLVDEKYMASREEAVDFGAHLMAIGLLKHATDDQKFKDSNSIYYQFTSDTCNEQQHPVQTMDFVPIATFPSLILTISYYSSLKGYGFEVKDSTPLKISSVTEGGPAETVGLCAGLEVVGIGGQWLDMEMGPYQQCKTVMESHKQMEAPLEVIVKRESSESISLSFQGKPLGFQVKGNFPVVINKVETGSEAAKAGITPGCCILRVEDENVLQISHDKVVAAIKTLQENGKDTLSLKIGIPRVQHLTRYRYESTGDNMVEVSERVAESPYLYNVPAQLFKLYDGEAKLRAKLLSSRRVASSRVEDYIIELQVQSDNYCKAHVALATPRYPSYRPYGVPPPRMAEACPINLHTMVMEVGPSSRSPSSPTPCNDVEQGSIASSLEGQENYYITEHFTNTMALPYLMNRTHSLQDAQLLKECQEVRKLLADLDTVYVEIIRDSELLQRLSKDDTPGTPGNSSPSPMLSLPKQVLNSISPTASPLLGSPVGSRTPFGRQRNVSFVNPSPLVKIVLDGVSAKISVFKKLLEDSSLIATIEKGINEIKDNTKDELLSDWLKILHSFKEEIASLADSQEAVKAFAQSLTSKIRPMKKDIEFYLETALVLCDNVEVTYSWDRLFCQCLVATVTGFANMLMSAAKGRLNHACDYVRKPNEASQQWLDLIAAKGVLVCFNTLLLTTMTSELSGLKDMIPIMKQLRTVTFYIREQTDPLPSTSNLPPVILTGNHNRLHVTFSLPGNLLELFPESLCSGEGISLCPVLFNIGLQQINESSSQYKLEQQINEESLIELRSYYRAVRQFELNKAVLPDDEAERTLVLQKLQLPLNAMDNLVRQLEGNIREPLESGTQLLVLISELAHRLGSIHISVCESGVYRSQACTTLKQVLLLVRCHELQARTLRQALSAMRMSGAFPFLEKKNSADKSKSFPKQPSWLLKLPDTT